MLNDCDEVGYRVKQTEELNNSRLIATFRRAQKGCQKERLLKNEWHLKTSRLRAEANGNEVLQLHPSRYAEEQSLYFSQVRETLEDVYM